jgi:23S rRNA (uridine2552-2'-O)-methyltransferase
MKVRTRSKKVDKAWLHAHVSDPYVKLAQRDGYRSRAAYKLAEIDAAFGLVRPGQRVVDLGAAPGAWSQYLRRRMRGAKDGAAAGGVEGAIVALDLLPMEPIQGVAFVQGDFRDDAAVQRLADALGGQPADLVLSDMAPNLSGIASADAARIADLIELALEFAARHLRPQGALVVKAFHGSGYSQAVELFKRRFRSVDAIKPKASRDKSAETFLVGRGLKPENRD